MGILFRFVCHAGNIIILMTVSTCSYIGMRDPTMSIFTGMQLEKNCSQEDEKVI